MRLGQEDKRKVGSGERIKKIVERDVLSVIDLMLEFTLGVSLFIRLEFQAIQYSLLM